MAALFVWTADALAQDDDTPAQVPAPSSQEDEARQTSYLMQFAANNAVFDQKVERTAQDLFKLQISECPTPEKAVRQLPTRYGRIDFPPTTQDNRFPYPQYGVWQEHVKIRACDKLWTINMLAIARDGQDPLLLATLPGETLADPSAMHDTVRMGEVNIKKAASFPCQNPPQIAYTRMLGYRQPDGKLGGTNTGKGWFEEWEYHYCGNIVPLQILFTPNDKGSVDIKTRVVPSAMPKVPVQKPTQTPAAPATPSPAAPPAPTPTAPLPAQ